MLGFKKKAGKAKCPCGKFASSPGQHDGYCAWKDARDHKGPKGGPQGPQGPQGPRPPTQKNTSQSGDLSTVYDKYQTLTKADTSPNGNTVNGMYVAPDGFRYHGDPIRDIRLPDEKGAATEEQIANYANYDNPSDLYEQFKMSHSIHEAFRRTNTSHFAPIHEKILMNPYTSKTTRDAVHNTFQNDPTYQRAALKSLYTPEDILSKVSLNAANVGVEKAAAEHPYLPQEERRKYLRSPNKSTKEAAMRAMEREKEYGVSDYAMGKGPRGRNKNSFMYARLKFQ